MNSKRKSSLIILEVITALLCLLFISPLFILLFSAGKTGDSIAGTPLALDASLGQLFTNISRVLYDPNVQYGSALITSITVTVIGVGVGTIMAAMAAWALVRRKTRGSSLIFLFFVAALVIPFQVVMYPLLSEFRVIGQIGIKLNGSVLGLIIAYFGFMMPMSIFLFHGFIKAIPIDLEEAATIDGCGKVRTFFKIVFPLMRPIYVTTLILNGIWLWNDYLLPFIILGSGTVRTIPLALDKLNTSSYSSDMSLQLAAILLAILPVIIVFVFAQKFILEGMVDGAVK